MSVILVLGNKCKKVSLQRVDRALEYYVNCESENRYLMFSGGVSEPTEAEYMRDYAISKGVDESNIITENESRNTIENFEKSKVILDQNFKHGSCSVIVCTSAFHIKRSMVLARIILIGYYTKFIHTRESVTEKQVENENNALVCCVRDLATKMLPDLDPYGEESSDSER